jgi:2-(1,2-epoxy-1,2-dihydrophenyl)acetyl-CoA isomerase
MSHDLPRTEALRLELDDKLATLSLAQPDRGNPFDGGFTRDFKTIAAALWDLHERGELRGVLLRADGANFSYGGDLKSFYPVRDQLPSLVRTWTGDLHMGLQRFWQLPVPVVAAIQGFAMGGGVALLAGCDVVVAAAGSRYGSAFAQLGFSCDSGSSSTLTARMGMARARRFVMLAESLSSDEAMQAGLVDRVVPDDRLQEEARNVAVRFAGGPTLAYGAIKRLFLRAGATQLSAQLEDEALTLAAITGSHDAQEGIAAMVEKRKPHFLGR